MPNMKALLALIVLLFSGTAALAQPLSDVATYTNWSLQNSVNPFYTDGRKGITHEEATRLPVGTLITLPNGTTRALKRGETVWQIDREYAVRTPTAPRATSSTSVSTPRVEQTTKTTNATPTRANPLASEQARIQARHEAEQQTALLAEEALALRLETETNLRMTLVTTNAAFAATKKREAREQITSAQHAAVTTRTSAQKAHHIATVAEETARKTDSAKAQKSVAQARADANAALVSAAKAEALAKRAPTALAQWVWDFTPLLITTGLIGSALAYTAITALMFCYLPGAYNFAFRAAIESSSPVSLPVKILAWPGYCVGRYYTSEAFDQEHYSYICDGDEPAASDEDQVPAGALIEDDGVCADDVTIEEERLISPYPTDERVELHQVLH